MRHKNADMIIAKANNMDLVLFAKTDFGWRESLNDVMPSGIIKYYLCHPKHKEVCLAWLNGEDAKCKSAPSDMWFNVVKEDNPKWTEYSIFMDEDVDIRINPKKEKRWIAIKGASNSVIDIAYKSKEELLSDVFCGSYFSASGWQIIEIEVEV